MVNKKKILWFVRITLLMIIAVCLVKISQTYYLSVRHKKQQEELSAILRSEEQDTQEALELQKVWKGNHADSNVSEHFPNEGSFIDEPAQIHSPVIMEQFKGLYAENSDLIGWLSIPDTIIDYPVMQCEDNEYYLHYNFYQEEDKYGCLFVKDIADVNTPSTNFIIYGHNMKDGSMFGSLEQYREESFCKEHPLITFDTLYEERTYEIMAVFPSQVYEKDEDVFKYYQFYQADTEEKFLDFYENVMNMALYETGVTAAFGDTFLMLSTCAYHVEDGRFVVLAKRIV